MSFLANEFNDRSVLHGQMSLAVVNHIYVFHEVMNSCKKSKDSVKACFENVNIKFLILCAAKKYIQIFLFKLSLY